VTTYAERGLGEAAACFYGKYRGTVTANVDPERRGRVQVSCPAVLVDGSNAWALPSSPYAGSGVGLFAVPPVGANVWVEFEGGDLDYPILAGCFWGEREAPSSTGLASTKVLKTDCLTLTIDDTPGSGGVTLQVEAATGPLTIKLDTSGITLTNGGMKVQLGTASVSVNDGALEVT
jgi:uncharacterized protein involved in type VI secretion and phage assembly